MFKYLVSLSLLLLLLLLSLFVLSACDNDNKNVNQANRMINAQLKTVTLKVEKMTCAACPITVRKALEKVPGVAKAKADYKTKTATVSFDPKKTSVAELTKATTNAGYPSTLIQ